MNERERDSVQRSRQPVRAHAPAARAARSQQRPFAGPENPRIKRGSGAAVQANRAPVSDVTTAALPAHTHSAVCPRVDGVTRAPLT